MTFFQLAPNWKRILVKAHSIKFIALVIILQGLDIVWPYVQDYTPLSKLVVGLITMLISMAALWARLSYQPQLSVKKDEQA